MGFEVWMKDLKLWFLMSLFLLGGCFGSSPCDVKTEDYGSYVVVNITNTSEENLKLDAQAGSIALSVQKKVEGDWIYDMKNLTRKSGSVILRPKETKTIRKSISAREKGIKYRFEFACNGEKVKTKEF